jgi:hypothetical protein
LRLRRALGADDDAATAEIGWTLERLGHFGRGATLTDLQRSFQTAADRGAALRYVRDLSARRYAGDAKRALRARDRAALRAALARPGGLRARLRALALMPPGLMRAAGKPHRGSAKSSRRAARTG